MNQTDFTKEVLSECLPYIDYEPLKRRVLKLIEDREQLTEVVDYFNINSNQ